MYNNSKYKLDFYAEIECNKLFKVPFSSSDENKKELIENFVNTMYADIFKYEIKEITENEYNTSRDISKEEIKTKLLEEIR